MMRRVACQILSFFGSFEARALAYAAQNPRACQLERLSSIIKANRASRFGREHAFESIAGYRDFCRQVPIRDYEAFRPYIDGLVKGERGVLTCQEPFMLATTSGTSGSPKYIPITERYIQEFRRASVPSGYHLFKSFPGVAAGVTLSVASPAVEGRTACGLPYGAISGALFLREPALIRKYISPFPYEVFLIRDYDSRYYTLLRLAVSLPVTVIYTLNPSTIVLLGRRLQQFAGRLVKDVYEGTLSSPSELPPAALCAVAKFLNPDRQRARQLERLIDKGEFYPYRIWPCLQLVSCWTKAAAAFYLSDFPELFGAVPVSDITYGASEGRGTVFIGEDRQMLAIRSHFYEFVPEAAIDSGDPPVLLADELVEGEKYFILFTTSGGLYRYHINDVVKVVGFAGRTPLIEFQYKGGNICSFTGEKITELHVTEAMARVSTELRQKVRFFTVVPQFRPHPHYRLWVELAPEALASLTPAFKLEMSQLFDRCLGAVNVEYRTKRDSQRLDPVAVEFVRPGSYELLRKQQVAAGVADSQVKISHLNPKEDVRAFFQDALFEPRAVEVDTSV